MRANLVAKAMIKKRITTPNSKSASFFAFLLKGRFLRRFVRLAMRDRYGMPMVLGKPPTSLSSRPRHD